LKHLKTEYSYRQVPLSLRAVEALESLPRRIDGRQLVFAAAEGGHLNLGNFRRRDWYPALVACGFVHCPHNPRHPAKREGRRYICQQPDCGAAGLAHRIYDLRHTFASWSLAGGATIFELSRFMGASPRVIELYYGHLVRESAVSFRDKLDAYATVAAEAAEAARGR
jgi:integrase